MEVVQSLGEFEAQFREIITNGIDKRQFLNVTTSTANTEFAVDHGLGAIPNGYIVIGQDKAGDVYNSTTAWTTSTIYLKASVATMTLRLIVF